MSTPPKCEVFAKVEITPEIAATAFAAMWAVDQAQFFKILHNSAVNRWDDPAVQWSAVRLKIGECDEATRLFVDRMCEHLHTKADGRWVRPLPSHTAAAGISTLLDSR